MRTAGVSANGGGGIARRTRPLFPLILTAILIQTLLLAGTTRAATATSEATSSASADGEDRSLNSATLSLNTLTTSCNGACKTNSACVVLGQSSDNPINCVSDTRCVTLLSGKTALCMEPFGASLGEWVFAPAKASDVAGVAPFERTGLVQVPTQVRSVEFEVAATSKTPLDSLDVSSLNVHTFIDLILTGIDGALPLNGASEIAINNCRLTSVPTQFVAGNKVTSLNLSNNNIRTIPTDFQNQSFPTLKSLVLSKNQLSEFPKVVFNFTSLQLLALDANPFSAVKLTVAQFEFLSKIGLLVLNGTTQTEACPSDDVIAKLNSSFTFCVNSTKGSSGSSSNGGAVLVPATASPAQSTVAPAAQTNSEDSKSSSSSKTWIVVGVVLGCLVLAAIVFVVIRRKRQREESPKLANSATPSIAIGMGDLADHPYMELNAPSSSCSQTTSDFELLANVADGYIALTRLSYNDVFLHRMIRVSSRSELWFGEYMDESVIIKKIKSNAASKAVLREFVTEIEHMAELKHPRITSFKGAMWDNEGTELCAVVEYVENGALRDCVASSVGLSASQQHAIARQVVDALSFLHQRRIVHGRLNSFNVLLDKHYAAKLSLFAVFHYVKLSPLDSECGVFAAPEVLRGNQPTEKSDVFSLGVLLVELDTGENPVINSRRSITSRQSESAVSPKIGFRLSTHCSPVMQEIIGACLEKDPNKRPTMAEIALALKTGSLGM
ncbi:hypothetical protein Gpo141_00006190 [Globisporangium polare]